MTNDSFGWDSLLRPLAPSHFTLASGLFTTYDQADERFLAEEFLPSLLRMDRDPSEFQYFTVDLERRLRQLRDQLVIVSSTAREIGNNSDSQGDHLQSNYAWIWRYLRALRVGHDRHGVQHAKLWMMHWIDPREPSSQMLEIVVSSSNLTRSSFAEQLQGAWRVCLPMWPKSSKERLRNWGLLPAFLEALGKSTGVDGQKIKDFVTLLGYAECPAEITFVASVPGKHSPANLRLTPWGVAGLNALRSRSGTLNRISVFSPFVGEWDQSNLSRWCESAGSTPKKLDLIWIDAEHSWAKNQRWILPRSTLDCLRLSKVQLIHLPELDQMHRTVARFHEQHRQGDFRWSHAKLYRIGTGRHQRVLVSSANFSTSAWGHFGKDGSLVIQNFELGVCVHGVQWAFEKLKDFPGDLHPAIVDGYPDRVQAKISWVDARWDGTRLRIECRCDHPENVNATVLASSKSRDLPSKLWVESVNRRIAIDISWTKNDSVPQIVVLNCEDVQIRFQVMDMRPEDQMASADLEEVNARDYEEISDALLLEQYGGAVVEDDPLPTQSDPELTQKARDDGDDLKLQEVALGRDSYEIGCMSLARLYLGIVDKWSSTWTRCQQPKVGLSTGLIASRVRNDGKLLVDAFGRQAERDEKNEAGSMVCALIAQSELRIRLDGANE